MFLIGLCTTKLLCVTRLGRQAYLIKGGYSSAYGHGKGISDAHTDLWSCTSQLIASDPQRQIAETLILIIERLIATFVREFCNKSAGFLSNALLSEYPLF